MQYELGGPRVSVQTAYGVEVEVGRNDNSLIKIFVILNAYVSFHFYGLPSFSICANSNAGLFHLNLSIAEQRCETTQ